MAGTHIRTITPSIRILDLDYGDHLEWILRKLKNLPSDLTIVLKRLQPTAFDTAPKKHLFVDTIEDVIGFEVLYQAEHVMGWVDWSSFLMDDIHSPAIVVGGHNPEHVEYIYGLMSLLLEQSIGTHVTPDDIAHLFGN